MEIRSEQPENKASRVLIVDDNPEIREIIHILLGGEGYDIEEVKNGNEAILKTKENAFDLIILDIMMPGMDFPFRLFVEASGGCGRSAGAVRDRHMV